MRNIILLSLAALAAVGCGGASGAQPAPEAPPAADPSTFTVTADTSLATVAVEGTVEARHRAEISTRLMARVTDVPVEIGTRVRTGQTLIRLGVDDIAVNRAKAEAAVTVARAARDEALRQASRMDTLYAQDVVAQVQRDQARLGITQAESQLAMAEASLREVGTAAEYARIPAPFDGIVVRRTVDPGDLAAPGQPLLTIESGGARDVVVAVPPETAAGLAEGASVAVATRDGREAATTVRAIAGGADPDTRTVEVRLAAPSDWPTGVSATAFIPTGMRLAVTVPVTAIVRRGQLTGVRVVNGDVVTLRWVRLGRTVGERVEVLSGLEAGELVAS